MYADIVGTALSISAPKSTVTLFSPNPMHANTHTKIKISDAELPLVRNPKLLGVYLDTFFSFNAHCVQVTNRVSKRNTVLKALASTNWGHQQEKILMTYKALGRSIDIYTAQMLVTPAWKRYNEALRIITVSHKMLLVENHLNLLSAHYLVHCLDTENEGNTFH